jgi:hypothetical protein
MVSKAWTTVPNISHVSLLYGGFGKVLGIFYGKGVSG